MVTKKKKPLTKTITKQEPFEENKLDFLELENRIEHVEKALTESLENVTICMQHILEMNPKIKKCAERLGIES